MYLCCKHLKKLLLWLYRRLPLPLLLREQSLLASGFLSDPTAITKGCVWLRARVATYGPSLCAVNGPAYSVSVCGNMQTVHSQLQR
jgi:hypothetical protein